MRRATRDSGGNGGRGAHWIRDTKRRRIYWRDGFACVWCGSTSNALSLDHWLARERGGSNDAGNLLTSCVTCNARRQHKPAIEFGSFEALDRALDYMARPLPQIVRTKRSA